MCLDRLGKKSFTPISYFQAEIKIDYSKFETSVFVIIDNSINFEMINSTSVLDQDALAISANDAKLNKYQNDSTNTLVDVINANEGILNSKF